LQKREKGKKKHRMERNKGGGNHVKSFLSLGKKKS